MVSNYKANTSFSKAPNLPQIGSYVLVMVETCIYFAGLAPRFAQQKTIVGTVVLHTITLAAVVVSTAVAGTTDPTDSTLRRIREGDEQFEREARRNKGFCEHCSSFVNDNSKHCKVCDRCIEHFDHHCMWINNCVGSHNYRPFMAMIVSATLHLASYLVALSLLTAQSDYNEFVGIFAFAWAVGVVVAIFFFLLLNLNCLHIYLYCKGLTTYEFILAQRKQNAARLPLQNKIIPDSHSNLPSINHVVQLSVIPSSNQNEYHQNPSEQSNNVFRLKNSEQAKSINSDSIQSQNKHSSIRNSIEEDADNTQIKISRVFLKNKSLKLILGNSEIMQKKKNQKDSIHNSQNHNV